MIRLILCFVLMAGLANEETDWPEFRGPGGHGRSAATGLPQTWSETKNVKWRTPIHGRGWSSPVVWGDQIWLTTATEDGRSMFALCLDRRTGEILLDRKLFDNPAPEPIHDVNSYASPTPVIEEGRVYVHFGRYGTACLDTRTFRPLWMRHNLPCTHEVGPGSSPVLFDNLLILTMDGIDVQYVIALDKRSGQTVWKTDRSTDFSNVSPVERKAFSTPTLALVNGQPQLISPGAKAAFAYDPRNGREIWRFRNQGYSNSCRPSVGHGLTFINTGFGDTDDLYAVRLDGTGDVTNTHILWRYSRNVPQKPSVLLVDDLLYMVNDGGIATCLEAKTGREVWKERIGGSYSASPLYADGRIYCFSEQGRTVVLRPGRKFEILAENRLPDGCMASPAVAGRALIVRTKTALYCLQEQAASAARAK